MDQIFLYNNASTVVVKGQRSKARGQRYGMWNAESRAENNKEMMNTELRGDVNLSDIHTFPHFLSFILFVL
jgi:hypothetical protein